MKAEFKTKFLQHLLNKKENEGFTLIELLVVIIIIGILAAIALPSFLNQANKARASEAKTYVGSMNRAQQAYILENPRFVTNSTDFARLGLGIATETQYYTYDVDTANTTGVVNSAVPTTAATDPPILKAYTGSVIVGQTAGGGTGEATTLAVLCETLDPVTEGHTITPAAPDATPATDLECPAGEKEIQ